MTLTFAKVFDPTLFACNSESFKNLALSHLLEIQKKAQRIAVQLDPKKPTEEFDFLPFPVRKLNHSISQKNSVVARLNSLAVYSSYQTALENYFQSKKDLKGINIQGVAAEQLQLVSYPYYRISGRFRDNFLPADAILIVPNYGGSRNAVRQHQLKLQTLKTMAQQGIGMSFVAEITNSEAGEIGAIFELPKQTTTIYETPIKSIDPSLYLRLESIKDFVKLRVTGQPVLGVAGKKVLVIDEISWPELQSESNLACKSIEFDAHVLDFKKWEESQKSQRITPPKSALLKQIEKMEVMNLLLIKDFKTAYYIYNLSILSPERDPTINRADFAMNIFRDLGLSSGITENFIIPIDHSQLRQFINDYLLQDRKKRSNEDLKSFVYSLDLAIVLLRDATSLSEKRVKELESETSEKSDLSYSKNAEKILSNRLLVKSHPGFPEVAPMDLQIQSWVLSETWGEEHTPKHLKEAIRLYNNTVKSLGSQHHPYYAKLIQNLWSEFLRRN